MGKEGKSLDFSVVLPAHNEEKNVTLLYQEMADVLKGLSEKFEIIYIDDGSRDGTFKELVELHQKDNRVKVIKLRGNFGQTAALDAGFRYASGATVISMDSDLQDDPKEIPAMLKHLERGFDVVCAWRQGRADKLGKKITSRIAWLIRQLIVRDGIHDSGCQFRIYRREAVKDLELYGELHRFIPALLMLKGYKVTEHPVHHRQRKFGKTKYNVSRVFKGMVDLVNVKFWKTFAARPMHFFGISGIGLAALGVLSGIYLIYEKFAWGASIANRPLLILTALLVMVGMQLFLMGVLADIIIKIYRAVGDRKLYTVEKVVE